MPERDDRDVDADQTADLRRVHAGGVDDHLALDRALVGDDLVHAAVAQADVGDRRTLLDLRAERAGAVGEGERQLARIEVAVAGEEGAAPSTPFGLSEREALLRLLRRDDLHRQPERPRPGRLAPDLLEARPGRGQPQAAELVPARILARSARPSSA